MMNSNLVRLAVIGVLAAAVAGIVALKSRPDNITGDADAPAPAIPRLVDLGADKCVPCRQMAPILDELKAEYAGQFEVQFIDVWKNQSQAAEYGIKMIPTQIFYDAQGQELFRHQGFFSKEDILETWQRHGFSFEPPATAEAAS